MICVLKFNGTEITGWIIGRDIFDVRDRAQAIGEDALLDSIKEHGQHPEPGRTSLAGGKYLMLVDPRL